jgi:SpoVK/Ycf46/Vps4 family AAA+-type ATPase
MFYLNKIFFKAMAGNLEQEENSNFVDKNFVNIPLAIILTLLSIYSVKLILEKTIEWWKKNKIVAICILIIGLSGIFIFKFFFRILSTKMSQKLEQAEKLQFIVEIPYQKKIKNPSRKEELINFLKNQMFYAEENLENIVNIYNAIKFGHERNYAQKILINGFPGVGKTEIIKKICAQIPNGAILIDFSAFIKFQNLQHTDISQEIRKLEEICDRCEKEKMILIFDDAELFLQTRQYKETEAEEFTKSEIKQNKIASILLGILCNFWLSMLSAKQITIIVISNALFSVRNTIDQANARRIEKIFSIKLPNFNERIGILRNYLKGFSFLGNENEIFCEIAKLTDGFSGRELKLLSDEAVQSAKHKILDINFVIDVLIRAFVSTKNKQKNLKKIKRTKQFIEDLKIMPKEQISQDS